MKNATKMTITALLCVFVLVAIGGVASAALPDARSAQTITTDTSHSTTLVTQFAAGQTVYVEYTVQAGKTANIVIYDDDDNAVPGTPHLGITGSGEFTFTPPHPGFYYVEVDGNKGKPIAVASFFILPESVLGTVGAIGAGLAAFGIVKFKRKKN